MELEIDIKAEPLQRGKFQGNNNAPKFAPIANDELKGDGLVDFIADKHRFLSGVLLPALNDHVHVNRSQLNKPGVALKPLAGDHRSAAATKHIKNQKVTGGKKK